MRGRVLAEGSLLHADRVVHVTHPVIERIQAAGGIVHIRTTTPEFSCAGFTHGRLWGITRNPWNLEFSPGGSSGGSGAALAAGYAPVATGSDIGGSIRIPASFSGVVGFKPPYGRVPAFAPFNLDQYCHDGPMARTVADCALLEQLIAGRHPHDVVSLPDPPILPTAAGSIAGLRIALCLRLGDFPLDPEVEANTRRTAVLLEDLGAIVEEVGLPWTVDEIHLASRTHFAGIFGSAVGAEMDEHADLLTPYARRFATRSRGADVPSFVEGMALEGQIYRPLGELLERVDALLCPTMGTRGYRAGDDYVDTVCEVDGVALEEHILGALTLPFNIASRCPVLSVPSGFADNGVPTGVQIVGRTYDDVTVFRIALAIEEAVGGLPRPSL